MGIEEINCLVGPSRHEGIAYAYGDKSMPRVVIVCVCVVGGWGTNLGEGARARHPTREGLQHNGQRAHRHGSNGEPPGSGIRRRTARRRGAGKEAYAMRG